MVRRGTLNWSLDADTQHAARSPADDGQFQQVMGRPMQSDPILPSTRVKAMTAQGYWKKLILTDYFDRCLAEVPDKTAVVDFNSTAQTENPWKMAIAVACFFSGRRLDESSRKGAIITG